MRAKGIPEKRKWVRIQVSGYIDVLTDLDAAAETSTHHFLVKNSIDGDGITRLMEDGNIVHSEERINYKVYVLAGKSVPKVNQGLSTNEFKRLF